MAGKVWLRDRPVSRDLYEYVMANVQAAGAPTDALRAKLTAILGCLVVSATPARSYTHVNGSPVNEQGVADGVRARGGLLVGPTRSGRALRRR